MFSFGKGSKAEQILTECVNWHNHLNTEMTKKLNDAQLATRPVKSNGLWCHVLLPTVLMLYTIFYKVSYAYKVVAFVSVGLMFYSTLFIIFASISSLVLRQSIYGGGVASSMISALLIYTFLVEGLLTSLIYSVSIVWSFNVLLRYTLKSMPKAFTVGEAMVVVQSVCLSILSAIIQLMVKTKNPINMIVYTILSTVGLIVTALHLMRKERRNLRNVSLLFFGAIVFMLIVFQILVGLEAVFQIFLSIFTEVLRVNIFIFWLALVIVAAALIYLRIKSGTKANTVTRKIFHLLATLVFISGILCDLELMRLAAGAAFGLLILIEAFRKFDIKPFSEILNPAFNVYSDEKDVGGFSLTPIYLFAGLACPLAVVPTNQGSEIELLSGVLSIGIGDTAASFFGSRYGIKQWRGTNKTIEGTIANILSQIIAVYVLQIFGLLQGRYVFIRAAVAAIVSGVVEANTEQVDNLILPLISIIAFQLTSFLNTPV